MATFSSSPFPTFLLSSSIPPPPPSLLCTKPISPSSSTHLSMHPKSSTPSPNVKLFKPILNSHASNPSTFDEVNPPSSRIFVKGLSHSTYEGSLMKVFSRFGDISKVKMITSKSSKEPLGLAYIWFVHEEDALLAVKEMDGKFVDGRFIAVMIARTESPTKQFALANEACAVLPSSVAVELRNNSSVAVELRNNTSVLGSLEDDDDDDDSSDGDDNDDGSDERERAPRHPSGHGNRQRGRHGSGNRGRAGGRAGHGNRGRSGSRGGHRNRVRHGNHGRHRNSGGHREEPRVNRDCCRWMEEVDEQCVCAALHRLPPFLFKPEHTYKIKVGSTCSRTFECHGV